MNKRGFSSRQFGISKQDTVGESAVVISIEVAQVIWLYRQEFSVTDLLGGSEEMEDIQRLFEENQGKGVEIILRGENALTGMVEDAQNNHVVLKNDIYYIFYRQIIFVRRV